MNKKFFAAVMVLSIFLSWPTWIHAAQSTITEVTGTACMGDDKSKKQTEAEALANAKRSAVENASTYIKSETKVKDFQLEKDLINAYAQAKVKVIQEIEKAWYRDTGSGDCCRVRIKAEVVPEEKSMQKMSDEMQDNPEAPLRVQVWADKKEYRQAEKIKLFLKGNKPFFARVLYRDVKGTLLQLLPNPHRTDHYFQGGVVYELPAGNDKFELEVSPPFGEERVVVYAGSEPLGDLNIESAGAVYAVKTKPDRTGLQTRGIKFVEKNASGVKASEFYESAITIRTTR